MNRRKKNNDSNSKIRNATKIEENGIQFDSKLELFTYKSLLSNDIVDFKYEGYRFTITNGFEYNTDSYELNSKKEYKLFSNTTRPITYKPDFVYLNEDTKEGWVIEVKGFPSDSFQLRWKLFKKYLVDNNYHMTLYKPNNQANVLKTIQLIKDKYYVQAN